MNGLESLKQQYVDDTVLGEKLRSFPVVCEQSLDCREATIGTVEALVDEWESFFVVARGYGHAEPVCEDCKDQFQGSLARVTRCKYEREFEGNRWVDEWIEPSAANPVDLSLPVQKLPTEFFVSEDKITCPECGSQSAWSKSINTVDSCFFECPECRYLMDVAPPSEWVEEDSPADSEDGDDRPNEKSDAPKEDAGEESETARSRIHGDWDPFRRGTELRK